MKKHNINHLSNCSIKPPITFTHLATITKTDYLQKEPNPEVIPLADTAKKTRSAPIMSIEQFLEWQDEDRHAEWADGKVILMSPASRKHQDIVDFLSTLMRIFAETHALGKSLIAPFSMHLASGPSVREPDLLFVRNEHLDRLKDTYLDGPADLVVEIISPESIGRDRGDKFVEYEQAGIPEYWLIDPTRQHTEFYYLKESHYTPTDTPDNIFRSKILTGFWLNTNWLWQDPLPNTIHILRELKIIDAS